MYGVCVENKLGSDKRRMKNPQDQSSIFLVHACVLHVRIVGVEWKKGRVCRRCGSLDEIYFVELDHG